MRCLAKARRICIHRDVCCDLEVLHCLTELGTSIAESNYIQQGMKPLQNIFFSTELCDRSQTQQSTMGFIDNKYVAKFIAGGAAPPLPPAHPSEAISSAPEQYASQPVISELPLPPGWIQHFDPNTQKVYYLEQATGLTQWVQPAPSQPLSAPDSSAASTMSSSTAHTTTPLIGGSDPKQHDVVRRNHVYLNLPTATEREEMRKKAEEKRAREGEKPCVLG
jgi:hypothetical protein